jgi:hypothetical protein
MDIPFPSQLQWVTPLVGSHWPAGSESAWWRTAGYLRDTAAALEAHIPDLHTVRSKTHAVLVGETAQAFEQQTAQLFSGDTAVHKKVAALRSLGDAAETLGTEIQYTKLSIYSMLVIAAASIVFAVANSEWTLGASLAEIPVIRWLTENAMARLVSMVLGRIEAELAARLNSMLVARLVVEGMVSAGIGAAQEAGIEAIQVGEGRRDGIDVGTVLHSALSMGAAGMAGGWAGHEVGGLVGTQGSTAMRALKGAVTGLASAEAANVAGTLTGGGHIGADTLLGGAIGVVHGGLGGAVGEHGASVPDPAASALAASATEPARPASADVAGTQAGTVGDPSTSTSDGVPQALAASSITPAADPAAAGEGATASPGANGSPATSDSAAKAPNGSTPTATSAPGEAVGPRPGSVNATPAAPDTAASPAGHLMAGVDAVPASDGPIGSAIPEGRLDLSSPAPAGSLGPGAEARSPAGLDLVGQSGAVGLPAGTPDMPRVAAPDPSSTPPVSSDRVASVEPSSSTPDARAGLAESSSAAGESAAQPAAGAARSSDAMPAPDGPRSRPGEFERAETGQPGGSVVERHAQPLAPEPAAAGQAGRPGTDAHLVGRGEGDRAESGRTADPLTKRQDPSTRPDVNRRDSSTGPRGRPGKLHRSGVARDVPEDLQPAATRARDPLAAAEDIGVIKARHGDSGPGPGDPESHKGGGDGIDGQNTPDPSTAGGGSGNFRGGGSGHRGGAGDDRGEAGDDRGGDGDHRGGAGGGAGDGADASHARGGSGDGGGRGAGEGSHGHTGEGAVGDKGHRSFDDVLAEFREAYREEKGFVDDSEVLKRMLQNLGSWAVVEDLDSSESPPPDRAPHTGEHRTVEHARSDVEALRDEGGHSSAPLPEADLFGGLADLPSFHEVRRIASLSQTLVDDLRGLRANGWRFKVDFLGGTSTNYANRIIAIDPINEQFRPVEMAHAIAHEVGHAINPQRPIKWKSLEAFLESQLPCEGEAEMYAIKVRREILANGGADPALKRDGDEDFRHIYDAYLEAGSTSEAYETAISEIGEMFGSYTASSEGITYRQKYTDFYNEHIRGKRWLFWLARRGDTL